MLVLSGFKGLPVSLWLAASGDIPWKYWNSGGNVLPAVVQRYGSQASSQLLPHTQH